MKRQKLLAHLRQYGCQVVGEGARHTRVLNRANGRRSAEGFSLFPLVSGERK
jgi:hypothetical protein